MNFYLFDSEVWITYFGSRSKMVIRDFFVPTLPSLRARACRLACMGRVLSRKLQSGMDQSCPLLVRRVPSGLVDWLFLSDFWLAGTACMMMPLVRLASIAGAEEYPRQSPLLARCGSPGWGDLLFVSDWPLGRQACHVRAVDLDCPLLVRRASPGYHISNFKVSVHHLVRTPVGYPDLVRGEGTLIRVYGRRYPCGIAHHSWKLFSWILIQQKVGVACTATLPNNPQGNFLYKIETPDRLLYSESAVFPPDYKINSFTWGH